MTAAQDTNDALALMGVKLTPMAEMYADLHQAYEELLAEHAALSLAARAVFDVWANDLLLEQGCLPEAMRVLYEALP